MINLSKDINEAALQVERMKHEARIERPQNPDIPTGAGLSGHQMYFQFAYRMAKFDSEFTQVDPVIGGSWLNIGVTRLLNEFEKRMLSDDTDRAVHDIFGNYIHIIDLVEKKEDGIPFGEYHFDIPEANRNSGARPLPDKLEVLIKLNKRCAKSDDFPKWWPVKEYKDTLGVYYDGDVVNTGYIELDGMKYKNKNFYVSNSLSSVRDGIRTKPYLHRQAGGFPVYVYLDSWENQQRSTKSYAGRSDVPNKDLGGTFSCVGVKGTVYHWTELVGDYFIDSFSEGELKLPAVYHNSVVDYAIDAYFESMFFHQFGKYSMKQAREDSEQSPTQSNTAMRQGKMDAVPPNRFKMTGPNAG